MSIPDRHSRSTTPWPKCPSPRSRPEAPKTLQTRASWCLIASIAAGESRSSQRNPGHLGLREPEQVPGLYRRHGKRAAIGEGTAPTLPSGRFNSFPFDGMTRNCCCITATSDRAHQLRRSQRRYSTVMASSSWVARAMPGRCPGRPPEWVRQTTGQGVGGSSSSSPVCAAIEARATGMARRPRPISNQTRRFRHRINGPGAHTGSVARTINTALAIHGMTMLVVAQSFLVDKKSRYKARKSTILGS